MSRGDQSLSLAVSRMLDRMPSWNRLVHSRWLFRGGLILAVSCVLLVAGLLVYGAYLATFLELPRNEDHPALRLYTAPFQLKAGLSLTVSHACRNDCSGSAIER